MTQKDKIRLILRQLNGVAEEQEKKTFSNWLLQDSDNLDLYIEIKNLWDTPRSRNFAFDESKAQVKISQVIRKEKKTLRLQRYSKTIAAASILLVVLSTFAYQYLKEPEVVVSKQASIQIITKHSEPGEQLRVTLPDASVVRLNAGSSISFPEKFNENKRKITLCGEAFFEVTKDPNRPFEVKTNEITTTVLGTSFNIKAFKHEHVTITVATGKVKVESVNADHVGKLLLLPNQQAIYNEKESHFRMEEVDARRYFAWTSGTIQFNNDPLEEVAKVLERWYNVKIQINNNTQSPIRINGSYTDKKLYTILDGLGYIYNLNYNYINDSTIVINSTP